MRTFAWTCLKRNARGCFFQQTTQVVFFMARNAWACLFLIWIEKDTANHDSGSPGRLRTRLQVVLQFWDVITPCANGPLHTLAGCAIGLLFTVDRQRLSGPLDRTYGGKISMFGEDVLGYLAVDKGGPCWGPSIRLEKVHSSDMHIVGTAEGVFQTLSFRHKAVSCLQFEQACRFGAFTLGIWHCGFAQQTCHTSTGFWCWSSFATFLRC